MVRITTVCLIALGMTQIASAQLHYPHERYMGAYGGPSHGNIAVAFPPSEVQMISDRHYDLQRSYPGRLIANHYPATQRPTLVYDERPCGSRPQAYPSANFYPRPEYPYHADQPSRRDLNTRRILNDRDKYVKNNLYGDDTIFDRDQPLRNIFRYVFP